MKNFTRSEKLGSDPKSILLERRGRHEDRRPRPAFARRAGHVRVVGHLGYDARRARDGLVSKVGRQMMRHGSKRWQCLLHTESLLEAKSAIELERDVK